MAEETTVISEVESTPEETGSYDISIADSQGLEVVPEALLMGEESDTEEETEEVESKAEETEETEESKTEEKPKEDEESETESKETASSEPKKSETPPKGYVPTAALHQARGENRYLKEQIDLLNEKIDVLGQPKENKEAPDPDFEVLSESAFEELVEDNPSEAIIYMQKLKTHEAYLAKQHEEQELDRYNNAFMQEVAAEATAEMEKLVPGLFNDDSSAQSELVEFAEKIGFDEDMFYLTNPMTRVILPGDSEPLLLGDQAVSVLSSLVKARTMVSEASVDESAIEERIRKEVTAELTSKFKEKSGDFRSIDELPKVEETKGFGNKVLSETEMSKLSSADLDKYLAGA